VANRVIFDQAELRRLVAELGKLDVKLQKKVFTQSLNATTRKVVLPAVKAKVNARSTDVFRLPYPKLGLSTPAISHTTPPGTLRKTLKVKALKRSRKRVGRLVATPTREALGIPDDYPGYYPAFLEYGSSKLGTKPRPYLRGTFEAERGNITRFFAKEARKRMKIYYPKGRLNL
tara:strand:+ start:12238 stop:12759 length:522 start_codon:yes stop_codon:yes gene_type:complete